jgi:glycosyltransferase involved in cell wall biosynthesis
MKPLTKLTICIITYNRGACALRQINSIKNDLGHGVSVLVLDNASTSDTEGYKAIEELSRINPLIEYIRHAHNRLTYGNFLACFDLAKTPYIQVMSDEDFPNIAMLRESIEVLEEFKNVAFLRGSIGPEEGEPGRNSMHYEDAFLRGGQEALSRIALRTNYLSGAIYNRDLIIEQGVVNRLRDKVILYRQYPHVYLDCLCASMYDVILTSSITCWEGPEDPSSVNVQNFDGNTASFTGRLEQILAFREMITELYEILDFSSRLETCLLLYELLSAKYFLLVKIDSFIYKKLRIDPDKIMDALLHFLIAASHIEIFVGHEKDVAHRIHRRYSLITIEDDLRYGRIFNQIKTAS